MSANIIRSDILRFTPAVTSPERYDLVGSVVERLQDWLQKPLDKPSTLQGIIDDLEDLMGSPDPPNKYARHVARFFILETYLRMIGEFPRPRFVADDENGMVITWSNGNKRVRLSCRGNSRQDHYLYYESPDIYGIEPELTPDSLKKRLEWLIAA